MDQIKQIYKDLMNLYGPQGWWPLISNNLSEYHPKDYSYPRNKEQEFEICIGAILTQNTSWRQTEKALLNLKSSGILNPNQIIKININKLKALIKPAGYFNQKSKKLVEFTRFYLKLNNKKPSRGELLNIWGIGQETADSMLLYAFKTPAFIIDNYTKRIFNNLNLVKKEVKYDEIKSLIEEKIKPNLKIYQEYHALLVNHAKKFYNKESDYTLCPLLRRFSPENTFLTEQ